MKGLFKKSTSAVLALIMLLGIFAAAIGSVSAAESGSPSGDAYLTVNATSNLFSTTVQTFDSSVQGNKVTVSYRINVTEAMLLDSLWMLTYDNTVFKVNAADNRANNRWNLMPITDGEGQYNINTDYNGKAAVMGAVTSINLFPLNDNGEDVTFVNVTFEVLNGGNTTVDLYVDILDFAEFDDETFMMKSGSDQEVIDTGVFYDDHAEINRAEAKVEQVTFDEPTTEDPSTDEFVYVVAGSAYLFDSEWDSSMDSGNIMEKSGDVYVFTIHDVPATDKDMQLKVVEHNISKPETEPRWIGDESGANLTFNLVADGDIIITYDPATDKITVEGAGVQLVTDVTIDAIRLAGNGDGTWLNGEDWKPAADANLMTEIADGIYEITYEEIEVFDNYTFKFAANGDWTDNWGGKIDPELTVIDGDKITYTGEAEYNGDNITFEAGNEDDDEDALFTVTIQLDLRGFVYATKEGATFSITVTPWSGDDSTPTVPPTIESPSTDEENTTSANASDAPTSGIEPETTENLTKPETQETSQIEPTEGEDPTEGEEPTEALTTEAPTSEPVVTEPITVAPTTAAIEPSDAPRLKGDVNSDGIVDSRDRVLLTRNLARWSGFEVINEKNSDINDDGIIDAKDRITLTRHLARWTGYEVL